MFLFFDTETTGLPSNWKAPPQATEHWPRIVQIAWILADENGEHIQEHEYLIKPDGFEIPAESTNIHGITTQQAQADGVELTQAITQFLDAQAQSQALVAHNIMFDTKVLAAECFRNELDTSWLGHKQICTMKESTNFCQLPGRYGNRWPKLLELHEILFEKRFEEAHDALVDVRACAKCFYELVDRGVLKTQKL